MAGVRATPDLPAWVLLESVSAYYYTGAVSVFVGVLVSLGLFLASYRGDEGETRDKWLGILGGLAAAAIVLFPGTNPPGVTPPGWWHPWMNSVHLGASIVLFLDFAVFATFVFTQSDAGRWSSRAMGERIRNVISVLCGAAIAGGMGWGAYLNHLGQPIFWQEVIAIEAFAISWLVKGEAQEPVVELYEALRSHASRR